MSRSKKRNKVQKTMAQSEARFPRLWWDASKGQLLWFIDNRQVVIASPEELQRVAHGYSCVLVAGTTEQLPARVAAMEALAPECVKLVMPSPARQDKKGFGEMFVSSDADKKKVETVVVRNCIRDYDIPLTRLQLAVFGPNHELDPVFVFYETWAGKFHHFWDLPVTPETAEFWARVGDVHYWFCPPDACLPDLSTPAKLQSQEVASPEESTVKGMEFLLFFVGKPKQRKLPDRRWPLGDVAANVVARRSLRRLLPTAWAGSPDVEAILHTMVGSSQEPLKDPRGWLWRALLRSSPGNVNRAYIEAILAWVLSRLVHPELFPPPNPLFDEPAAAYWQSHREQIQPPED